MTPAAESTPQPQIQQAAAPQVSASQTPVPETQAPRDGAPQTTVPQVAAPETALQPAAAPQTNAPEIRKAQDAPAKEIVVQIAALQNTAKPADSREPANIPAPESADASVRTDAAKPVTPGASAEQAEHKDAKPDAVKPEIARTDSAKPDQPAPVEVAAPKAPPQTHAASNTNIAVQGSAAPQSTTTPSVLPGIPQHVQVSAESAKPNMPALAVEIAAKSQSGAKQFDIRLDPPELGRVEIRLSIDAAGKASAHLSADQPQTLDLLQKDAASLTRALREAGLNVSQDGLNFSLRQQSHDGNGAQQGQGQARHASRSMTLIATNSIEATQTSAAYRGDGRLDIRV
jgi:flagellar hook-length control protein FliK